MVEKKQECPIKDIILASIVNIPEVKNEPLIVAISDELSRVGDYDNKQKFTKISDFYEAVYDSLKEVDVKQNSSYANLKVILKSKDDEIKELEYNYRLSFNNAIERFKEKEGKAKEFMKNRIKMNSNEESKILIGVCTQHPLIGGQPGKEFQQRLDLAITKYKELKTENKKAKIYLFGGRHRNDYGEEVEEGCTKPGDLDPISLAVAGRNYLTENGIDESDVFANDGLKEGETVYSSGDEQYQLARVFKNNEKFVKFYSIGSPSQSFRNMVHAIFNGIIPTVISPEEEGVSHNISTEFIITLDLLRQLDPTFQDPKKCKFAWLNRIKRMPLLDLADYLENLKKEHKNLAESVVTTLSKVFKKKDSGELLTTILDKAKEELGGVDNDDYDKIKKVLNFYLC